MLCSSFLLLGGFLHPPFLFEVRWLIFYSLQNLTKPAWQKNSGWCQKKVVAGRAVPRPRESRWSQKTLVPRNRLCNCGKQREHSSEQDRHRACPLGADVLIVTAVGPGRRLHPSGPFLTGRPQGPWFQVPLPQTSQVAQVVSSRTWKEVDKAISMHPLGCYCCCPKNLSFRNS